MLGKTAGGLFWMFRYLERSESTTRLLDAGFRIALTHSSAAANEWASIISTAGSRHIFEAEYPAYQAPHVVNFLLRDRNNPSSVLSAITATRDNARLVRTALTREVWEATNECWITLKGLLGRPVQEKNLPSVLGVVRQQSALVRAALHGTMLRNDIYNFSRLGTFIERADSTARILDAKYYVLLPSVSHVGSPLDNIQWESILRSVSGMRAYRWLHGADIDPTDIANFLVLDRRMPRSLAFCYGKIVENLNFLSECYSVRHACHDLASNVNGRLRNDHITSIMDYGLHEYIERFLRDTNALGAQIETDFRFYE